jgi:predicted transposase/invertase (TIGR01784 family)
MRKTATFADPKADVIFKRIFGTEAYKHLLIELLNALLELEEGQRILDVTYLPPEQSSPLPGMKFSVVDVKCRDERGKVYVVEMQVLNVEGFEKRVVLNAAKACTMQLEAGEAFSGMAPVVALTICNFRFWSAGAPMVGDPATVPMLSRWHMQEQRSGVRGFPDMQYCFLELPKYAAGEEPVTAVDCWAYLFLHGDKLKEIPPFLDVYPYRDVLEIARISNFTTEEWEVYDKSWLARHDAHAVVSYARKEGLAKGRAKGRREEGEALGLTKGEALGYAEAILRVAESRGTNLDTKSREAIPECQDAARLKRLFDKVLAASSASEIQTELERFIEEL